MYEYFDEIFYIYDHVIKIAKLSLMFHLKTRGSAYLPYLVTHALNYCMQQTAVSDFARLSCTYARRIIEENSLKRCVMMTTLRIVEATKASSVIRSFFLHAILEAIRSVQLVHNCSHVVDESAR